MEEAHYKAKPNEVTKPPKEKIESLATSPSIPKGIFCGPPTMGQYLACFSSSYSEQQPSDEHPKQKEVPPASQDIIRDQGKEVEGAPVAQGRDLEADLQELPQAKAGGTTEDDPEVKGTSLPIKMPEAGEGQPQI
ncbi:hypothetical protein PANDA_021137 [Ailuropoda melanoleuca]|uniref:GAGE domain-containing protein n=1 Tax=Ailuropoda melanoleuca TaxID=9646 RepID=D2I5Y7_AILME|nr:hypothetical protein PANDA_021137 [Ailuropoda melanoleuca]